MMIKTNFVDFIFALNKHNAKKVVKLDLGIFEQTNKRNKSFCK